MTKHPTKQKTHNSLLSGHKNLIGILAFVIVVGVISGFRLFSSFAYSGDHSECSNFALNTNVATPGQALRADYQLTNDGSTTWSDPTYTIIDYYGNIPSYRYGNRFGSSHGPSTTPFSVSTGFTAPSKTGTFSLQLGVHQAGHGPIPNACPVVTLTVQNPPAITGFGASPSTITAGSQSKLFWSSSSNGCTLTGGSTNASVSYTGSTFVKPSSTTSYSLKCSNLVGTTSAGTSVTVKPAPIINRTPATHSNPGASNAPDSQPPSTPTDFVATNNQSNKTVDLSWTAATDDVGVKGYQLDSSVDQQNWTNLSNNITDTNYEDNTVAFGTTYYYRLRAFDAAGNTSDYVTASVGSSDFAANVQAGQDNTVTSSDKVALILIPKGALIQDVFCDLSNSSDVLAPNISGYVFVAGPYQLVCRDNTGNIIGQFDKPLVLTAQASKSMLKAVSKLAYYGQKDDGSWEKLTISGHDKKTSKDTVKLNQDQIFAIMGLKRHTSILVKLLEIIIVLVGLLFLARFIVRFLLKRKTQGQYDDYWRKSQGL